MVWGLVWSLLLLSAFLPAALPIQCTIGYGQRGKKYSNEITWVRTCPMTDYCFEVVTTDIKKVQKLVDYPWDSYYSQYWIKSCGGDLGTRLNYHPWRLLPRSARRVLGSVRINITTPRVITGHGGKELFDLRYTCRRDLCSRPVSGSESWRRNWIWAFTWTAVLALGTLWIF